MDPEPLLKIGDNHPVQIIVLEPFFEEANRCRHMIAVMMRALDGLGIGSRIVALPGTGESLVSSDTIRLTDWRSALAGQRADGVASFRGGALLDDAITAPCHWRFAPETGHRLVRDLKRTALAGGTLYAGHALSDAFLADLEATSAAPLSHLRTVRLESDGAEADVTYAGSPLWRRAEPGEDAALSAALAQDLADWMKQCAAS
jgi:hypothetical protein